MPSDIIGVCYRETTDQTTQLPNITPVTSIGDFENKCTSYQGLTFSHAYHTSEYGNICYALGSNETNSDTKIELINKNYGPNSPNSPNKIISNNGLSLTQCKTNANCNLKDIIAVYTDTTPTSGAPTPGAPRVINQPSAKHILIINDKTIDKSPFGLFSADEN